MSDVIIKEYRRPGTLLSVTTIYPTRGRVGAWTRKYPAPWDGIPDATGPAVPETDYEFFSVRGAMIAYRNLPDVRRAIVRWYPLGAIAAFAWLAYDRAYWRLSRWAYRWPRGKERRMVARAVRQILPAR